MNPRDRLIDDKLAAADNYPVHVDRCAAIFEFLVVAGTVNNLNFDIVAVGSLFDSRTCRQRKNECNSLSCPRVPSHWDHRHALESWANVELIYSNHSRSFFI